MQGKLKKVKQLVGSWRDRAFLSWLQWQTRPAKITSCLDRLGATKAKKDRETPSKSNQIDQVTVAAVQAQLRLVKRIEEYVEQMYSYGVEGAAKGAQLVVYPEDNGTHLLGLLPGIGQLDGEQELEVALAQLGGEELKVAHIFAYLSPVTQQVRHCLFSSLAARLQLYVMAGSFIVADEQGQVINKAFLYGPEGELVGSQTKTHLMPLERQWGLACGQELQVFSTQIGQLAFPVCMDASYYETFRMLSLMGAEIVLLPIANPEEYSHFKALRGIWPRVQESSLYGVKSALVGKAFGMTLTGKAGIYAPMSLTPGGDGVVAESSSFDQEEVVVASLDLAALREYRLKEAHPWQYNYQLYQSFFPLLYENINKS